MISVLIPIYNCSIKTLILSLEQATRDISFDYEVICLEDGSELFVEENKSICHLYNNISHITFNENKGRISSRKFLAQKAKYEWLLFLDADVELRNDSFIIEYSRYFNDNYDAIYGGYSYKSTHPNNKYILRWTYGKSYEAINSATRNKTPYKVVISGNFIIKKEPFLKINSKINKDGYGYDNIFGALMKRDKIKVYHIENPVYHNGLDENSVFLKKIESAIQTTFNYYIHNKSISTDNRLLEFYKKIKSFGLKGVVSFTYRVFKDLIKKQLLGNKPNMKLLQFYKLGYLCTLSPKKK